MEENTRERLSPVPGDLDFLILKDLVNWVAREAEALSGRMLDYGCGRSPYRALFGSVEEYLRADFEGREGLDHVLTDGGAVPIGEGDLDAVLSTQVLEHVADPHGYLREAARMLRPGGVLLLTTHGVWQDHAVPTDYQRWTADGLARDVVSAGFEIDRLEKFTCEGRGLAQLISRHASTRFDGGGVIRGCWRWGWRRMRPLIHRVVDRLSQHQGLVPAEMEGCSFYLGVAVVARRKPGP